MSKEGKQLLLNDLCARLPYAPQVVYNGITGTLSTLHIFDMIHIKEEYVDIKPYLRPMSSMTAEEIEECYQLQQDTIHVTFYRYDEGYEKTIDLPYFKILVDFYNSHHLDYRGLIPMGLALEAPEGMYKTE